MSDEIRESLDLAISHLQSRKAEDIVVLDLREIADFSDYFVICSGNSDTHVKAVSDAVLEGMKEAGQRAYKIEGYEGRMWVLIDYVDFVVHIFLPDARTFYGLERLWGDAPIERIEEVDLVGAE